MEESKSMACKLRVIMIRNNNIQLWLFLILQVCSIGSVRAEVLSPPPKVPFGKDVTIEKYASGNPIKLFKSIGAWEIKKINKKLSIMGTSGKTPIYLISLDLLSGKPKSFKLDFTIWDENKEYGFIFGEVGVLIRSNKMYEAVFDNRKNILKLSHGNEKPFGQIINAKLNTLDINTGYDPTDGARQSCTIYINGIGHTFNISNADRQFGIYVGQNNRITINNIRWGIGSK